MLEKFFTSFFQKSVQEFLWYFLYREFPQCFLFKIFERFLYKCFQRFFKKLPFSFKISPWISSKISPRLSFKIPLALFPQILTRVDSKNFFMGSVWNRLQELTISIFNEEFCWWHRFLHEFLEKSTLGLFWRIGKEFLQKSFGYLFRYFFTDALKKLFRNILRNSSSVF